MAVPSRCAEDRPFAHYGDANRSGLSDVVELIITLAHKMNLRVIAEGIERPRQVEPLRELGCELGQGYYFSQPLESKAVQQFLR